MADVLGKKISELAETTDLAGLYTIGSDRNNQSKKVPLQFVKEAADYANAQGDYAKGVGDNIQGNTGVNEYPTFSSSTQYAAGSVVRYNNKLYRFTALHPAGAWVGTDAIETSIKAESDVKLTELESDLGTYNEQREYIRVYLDENNVPLFGIKADGSIEWAKGIPTPIKDEFSKVTPFVDEFKGVFKTISNKEWLYAIVDSEDKILAGIKADGSSYIAKITLPKDKEVIEVVEDKEQRLELTIDENNKVVAYRKSDGTRHEEKMSINNLTLTDKGASDIAKALSRIGFDYEQFTDWSREKKISLPIPRHCAIVNIISETGLATTKTQDKEGVLQFWDKSGNYFQKPIIFNAQGSSSMNYIEKNQSIDIFNDDERSESCEITFGDWVSQDSFHLKCYYIDVFRGLCNIGYNICEEAIKELDSRNNRVKLDNSSITKDNSTGDFAIDFGDNAKCHPDGFPFVMYVNGEYYGLYVWNLKKHRANYSMKKNDYTTALLDGEIDSSTFFGGNIDWTIFELRNPKDLVTMDGKKYDADTNRKELIDESSASYDDSNSVHVKTASVKKLVIRQSNAIAEIANEKDNELAKEKFEQYYDMKAVACYFIMSNVLYHYDGFRKNWIWTIYGNIAAPSFYDMDTLFGRNWKGTGVESYTDDILGVSTSIPTGQLMRLYRTEVNAMYKQLRDSKIISLENIMSYVYSWVKRVGIEEYKANIEKWSSIPSYREEKTENDGTYDGGMFDSPMRIKKWLVGRLALMDNYFAYNL